MSKRVVSFLVVIVLLVSTTATVFATEDTDTERTNLREALERLLSDIPNIQSIVVVDGVIHVVVGDMNSRRMPALPKAPYFPNFTGGSYPSSDEVWFLDRNMVYSQIYVSHFFLVSLCTQVLI